MNITVLDDYQEFLKTFDFSEMLTGHNVTIWNDYAVDENSLVLRLKDTEVLVLIRERTRITASLIEQLSNLKIISQIGGCNHIDIDACTRKNVIISSYSSPTTISYATAELCWGLIIAALRRIPLEISAFKAGQWQKYSVGYCLRGKTLGLFGYGKIGAVLAGYGKAFGMKVLVWGSDSSRDKAHFDGYSVATCKEELFEESDVLSLHLKLSNSTFGIVNQLDLSKMKQTSLLVNTSRAELIERGALIAALNAGRPGMAAIDVYEDEPVLGGKHALLEMDNVVCTPHLGFVEQNSFKNMFNIIFNQIQAFYGGAPINVVNKEVLNKEV